MIASNYKDRIIIDHTTKSITVFGNHLNQIPFRKLCHGTPADRITFKDLRKKHEYKSTYPDYSIYLKWNDEVVKLK